MIFYYMLKVYRFICGLFYLFFLFVKIGEGWVVIIKIINVFCSLVMFVLFDYVWKDVLSFFDNW